MICLFSIGCSDVVLKCKWLKYKSKIFFFSAGPFLKRACGVVTVTSSSLYRLASNCVETCIENNMFNWVQLFLFPYKPSDPQRGPRATLLVLLQSFVWLSFLLLGSGLDGLWSPLCNIFVFIGTRRDSSFSRAS